MRFAGDKIIRMYGVTSSWITPLPPERKIEFVMSETLESATLRLSQKTEG